MSSHDREGLLKLLKEKSYRRGQFRLASGGTSEYYLDAKQVTFLGKGVHSVAKLFLGLVRDEKFVAIGGPSVGADPILGAMAAMSCSGSFSRPVNTFIVRSKIKDHGIQEDVAGYPIKKGDRVIVIDDVVTQGGSALKTIRAVRAIGCLVDKVIALVDRMEGGREKLKEEGCELISIFTCQDFCHEPPRIR